MTRTIFQKYRVRNKINSLYRASRKKEPKKMLTPATDQNGSQVNFYYGAPTPYAESIAPSHHSTYAHYYDDEEDGWEMPNFYNETYMKGENKNGTLREVHIKFHNFHDFSLRLLSRESAQWQNEQSCTLQRQYLRHERRPLR